MNLTPKQFKFAQLVAEGKTYSDAYRGAYNAENMADESINVEASKIMSNPNIAQRVQELRDLSTEAYIVTKESIARELDAQVTLASGEKQHSASISGINIKAKLYGLMVEKKEVENKGVVTNIVVKDQETADAIDPTNLLSDE